MKKMRKRFASVQFKIGKYFRNRSRNLWYPWERILKYKNLHKGERCFIVGTGPSLDIGVLNLLKNEYTFSMNSIIMAFNCTDWRPTYYVIQDLNAYNIFKYKLFLYDFKEVFIGINHRFNGIHINRSDENYNRCCFYPLYFNADENIYKIKFSDNCYKVVYDGTTVTYSILQLAMYMGFSEIYLLGIDCDYTSKGKKHFIDYTKNHNTLAAENKQLYAYSLAKLYADEHDVKIYNANRGGKLFVYPRIDLADILKIGRIL